jgi:SAM-dependent methyltransferase
MEHSTRSAYNVASFATSVQAEIRRLNAQVDLFWSAELELLKRYGLQDEMDVLDCGCGPGRLLELLKGQMPGLRLTGMEMDPLLVEAAGILVAERRLDRCRIVQGTAEQPGLPEASFDFIILRLVLEHVPDPLIALQNLGRLLRPGGRLVAIDNDFEFHLQTWPPVPQLDRLYEAYCSSRKNDGGDPYIGRQLPQLLTQAGLKVIGYEIEVAHNAVLGDNPFLRAEGAGIPVQLVRTGFLDEKTLEEMTHSWREMLADPDHSIVRPLFTAIGERSAKAEKSSLDRRSTEQKTGARPIAALTDSQTKMVSALGEILAILLTFVTEVLEAKLEELGIKLVGPGDMLADLGMDSLAALDLQEKIKDYIGIEIPIRILLANISIASLANEVEKEATKRGFKIGAMDTLDGQKDPVRWEEGQI